MADRDRFGEHIKEPCRDPRCRRGWVGHDDEGRPIPCLVCKDHLLKGSVQDNDFAQRTPSARAQQAIDADERENQTR